VRDSGDFTTTIPIGRPLVNTRAYVLDPQHRPVPAGEPGELFLGGEGVARGYWERPELTAERFIPERLANRGRMYRTGDIARFLPDGNLEFLGRTDHQVKLRGYRIELGEIEVVLEQNSAVQQAVVVVREDRPGDKRLVAYVVAVGGQAVTSAALHAALKSKLPEYAVPSHFVFLDRLPLTPNGKIDRKALPAVPRDGGSGTAQAVSSGIPRDNIERLIAQVWAEALGVEHVNLDENIFDMGATSLMVPDVQIELQRRLDREIPLVDLFEFHTVSTLAVHLRGGSVARWDSNRAQRRRAARNSGGRR
jgi:acyl carrier protein